MPGSAKRKKIDDLMNKASKALAQTSYFEAERMASKALYMAYQNCDFERMARILMPLQEARRQRCQIALDLGEITIIDEQLINEEFRIYPGCYLVRPPRVGAGARRLRLAALHAEIPVAVVCREPDTMLKFCPIVAISPGNSLRTKIDPPADPDHPDMAWFVGAMEALGDAAIEDMDMGKAVEKRVEYLMGCLDATPEHERLHQALAQTCQEAARNLADTSPPTASVS